MAATQSETGSTAIGFASHADADPVEQLPEGTIVGSGRYRIVDKIGEGAMATVYEAVDLERGGSIALKILTGRHRTRSDAEQRLVHEAQYAGQLPDHPNLVRPLGVGRLPELFDRPYLAMELAKGPLLAMVIIFETPMAVPRACTLVGDVARALVDLHGRGIIHRDIKPTNVLVVEGRDRQVAKLVDFGLATVVGEGRTAMHDLTATHDRPGTKRYMAPEQAAGMPATTAFDMYALGVVLHEALLGVTPWHDRSEDEVVLRKTDPEQPPFTMADVRPDVPPALRELVDRCLSREPEARPTAREVLERLESIVGGAASMATPGDIVQRSVERVRAEPRVVRVPEPTAAPPAGSPTVAAVPADEPHASSVRLRRTLVALGTVIVAVLLAAWVWRTTRTADEEPRPQPDGAIVPPTEPRPAPATPTRPIDAPAPDAKVSPPQPPHVPHEAAPPATPSPRPAPSASVPKPAIPAWQTDRCAQQRRAAEDAMRRNDPQIALDYLGERGCWQDKAKHRKLRVTALANTRRFSQCVKEGAGSTDPEVRAVVDLCKAKESSP